MTSKERKIIHIDMDCFFAAVEIRDNPRLENLPVAVGGSEKDRGVLSTCNYVARKWGLKSAMSTALAKKLCPELVLIPPHFEKYVEASHEIHDIFLRYTSFIEPLSLDEAYLDVTNSSILKGSATLMAKEIKEKIKKKTKLTASAGVAPNKFLAKIGSGYKKPDGLFVITPSEVSSFVEKLNVSFIPGVGKKTEELFKKINIFTLKDLQVFPEEKLKDYFPSEFRTLKNFSFGIDEREIVYEWEQKSLSVEHTFSKDISHFNELSFKLPLLICELEERLKGEQKSFDKLYVKLKFHDFTQKTIEKKFSPFFLEKEIFDPFKAKILFSDLLKTLWDRRSEPVRLLGVGVRFSEIKELQLEFF